MKTRFLLLIAHTLVANADAQTTAFTYQGRLNDGGSPATGIYDLRFTIYDALINGSVTGEPTTNSVTPVTNSLFVVTLDFGAGVFPGADRFLEIAVRTNGSAEAYTTLTPRQLVTSTPYAVRAANFSGAVSDSQLSPNIALLNGDQTFSGKVNFSDGSNSFVGSFSGSGLELTNADIARLTSGALKYGNFALASSPGVGSFPLSVTAADVNGDGNMDLISAGSGPNTLSVLINNGSGGFTLASSPNVGLEPSSVTAVDVNGDGYIDLISANANANTLTVLTNNGSGGFVIASSPVVGSSPVSVTAADVNGDGYVDLISANWNANTLTVLTNNGGGGFAVASSPNVGSHPESVAAADINGDGYIDLISPAYASPSTLTVLTNNGNGGFALASSPSVGDFAWGVTVADINGDGKADLISAKASFSGTLSVLVNNGSNGFARTDYSVGDTPHSVTAADVNGDGKVDLISANYFGNTLSLLTNNGSGGFGPASSLGVGGRPTSVIATDITGDGLVDLISANYSTHTLSVLFNTPTFQGRFAGNGAGLTNLAASSLSSGTLADARLSTNVALRNANQTFTGSNTFSNTGNSFTGNGAGLTSLNATNLTGSVPSASLTSVPAGSLTGTIADVRLSSNVGLLSGSQTFSGAKALTNSGNSFTGNGSELFSLNAANIGSGTLTDARLSANVPQLNANQTFSGSNNFTGDLVANGLFKLPRTMFVPASDSTIAPTNSFIILSPISAITLNTTNAIADPSGGADAVGTMLLVQGQDNVNTVTIYTGANTVLGSATRTLGLNDMLTLIFDGSVWIELSFSDN